MMIIFLNQIPAPSIILQDLLIRHPSQELMRRTRIDTDNMRRLARRKLVDAFTSLRIPKLHIAIIASRKKLFTIGRKVNIVNRLGVAGEGPKQLALVIHIPERNLGVGGSGEKKVATVGDEADLCDGLGVVFVGMEELFGDVVLDFAAVAGQLDVEIYSVLANHVSKWKNQEYIQIPFGTCMYVLPW